MAPVESTALYKNRSNVRPLALKSHRYAKSHWLVSTHCVGNVVGAAGRKARIAGSGENRLLIWRRLVDQIPHHIAVKVGIDCFRANVAIPGVAGERQIVAKRMPSNMSPAVRMVGQNCSEHNPIVEALSTLNGIPELPSSYAV